MLLSNKTDWKLLVTYSYQDGIVLGATIVPQGKLILAAPDRMKAMQIVSCGPWSKVQLRTPENLCTRKDFETCKSEQHMMLTITTQPTSGIIRNLVPFCFTATLLRANALSEELKVNEQSTLLAYFPNVAYALKNGTTPLPQHFLSLPDDLATVTYPKALEEAYQRLKKICLYQAQHNREFAMKALDLIQRAYMILKKQYFSFLHPEIKTLFAQGLTCTLAGKLKTMDVNGILDLYVAQCNEHALHIPTDELRALTACLDEEYALVMVALSQDNMRIILPIKIPSELAASPWKIL